MLVHTEHDGGRVVLGGRRKDHFTHTSIDVRLASFRRQEFAGGFAQVVNTHVFPGNLAGDARLAGLDSVAVDDQVVAIDIHSTWPPAVDRVILELVGHILDLSSRVDAHQLAVGILQHDSGRQSADSSEPVDTHCIFGHFVLYCGKNKQLLTQLGYCTAKLFDKGKHNSTVKDLPGMILEICQSPSVTELSEPQVAAAHTRGPTVGGRHNFNIPFFCCIKQRSASGAGRHLRYIRQGPMKPETIKTAHEWSDLFVHNYYSLDRKSGIHTVHNMQRLGKYLQATNGHSVH